MLAFAIIGSLIGFTLSIWFIVVVITKLNNMQKQLNKITKTLNNEADWDELAYLVSKGLELVEQTQTSEKVVQLQKMIAVAQKMINSKPALDKQPEINDLGVKLEELLSHFYAQQANG
ncbi:hypothetical protein [Williamsoniiplasma lucivorax]|uniref:Uncharacterized protein n=1 Tax=Williamsoniiplasma lucivorax TaxID=209274 RepID=A0A2S5RFK7_9MOLU|nr:hypothetical protein [Williamsoniiplasma lucivorax]PPE06119.1 hypothetical protein ELUCI_v1c04100 [Williamsoniiplasma lucivorax]